MIAGHDRGMELGDDRLQVTIDEACGGRVASIRVDGREVLVTGSAGDHPMLWGSFPMVPWAGRVRDGRFLFAGSVVQLARNLPPHAIHGVGYLAAWDVVGPGSLALDLGTRWPFGGRVEQHVTVDGDAVVMRLALHATDQPLPGMVGWHPWFVRPNRFSVHAVSMYQRDASGMPTGRLVTPPPGPWDDCFTGLTADPTLHYEGFDLVLSSTCDHWVVYDEPAHAVCIEPQSGPPDGFTLAPCTVTPPHPLVHEFTITVRRH
jgi:aldose 1-epimerase